MSDDGAQLGIQAEDAMKMAMGMPEAEAENPRLSTEEMAEWIKSCPPYDPDKNGFDYNECARYAARLIVEWLMEDPTRASTSTENVYERDENDYMVDPTVILEYGWYDRMKKDGSPIEALDLSGFMWGWAVNAARRCVELPEVSNPAIINIRL